MNRDEVFNLYKQLDKAMDCALAADKDEDDTEVVISYRLASAIGLILDRMVYPEAAGNTEPAAATQPTTRDEVRLIEAVRKATSTYDYDKVTTAHRNIGRLDALARHYGHEVDLQTVDALEHTLVGFDTSARRIISALKEFDNAR